MKKIILWQFSLLLSFSLVILWHLQFSALSFLFFLVPSILSFVLPQKNYVKTPTSIINSIFLILLFIESTHLFLYQLPTNAGVTISIFETNIDEAIEYLNSQNHLPIILFYLSLIGISCGIVLSSKKIKLKKTFLIWPIILILGITPYFTEGSESPVKYYDYINTYMDERADLTKRIKLQKYNAVKIIQNTANPPQTIVVILGESTTRNRMSLYGYKRKTTPRLEQFKDLIVFNNTISPHCYTYKSLQKVLTLSSHAQMVPSRKNVSIIQLAKAAHFKTYWISNQNPLGKYENYVTSMARSSDHLYWANQTSSKGYDENVLPVLVNILSKAEPAKFIIIHLQGTHAQYRKRYPESFHLFSDRIPSLAVSPFEIDLYNAYDNAVLYNDHIVSEIFTTVKKTTKFYSILYLSDHGEEVFQSEKISGHHEAQNTKNMVEIPFLLLTNNETLKVQAQKNRHQLWSIEDLIHTLHGLLSVKTNFYVPQNDIFSEDFIERDRKSGHKVYRSGNEKR